MAYPGAKQIGVHFAFPGGDRSKPPYVTNDTNDTNEIDVVEAQFTAVEWSAFAVSNDESLQITGVTFWPDARKLTRLEPDFFGPGIYFGRYNWVLPFKAGVAVPAELDLIYTLDFKDALYDDLTWDPTLKVQPRAAGQASGSGG